jgi:hypothetical protein
MKYRLDKKQHDLPQGSLVFLMRAYLFHEREGLNTAGLTLNFRNAFSIAVQNYAEDKVKYAVSQCSGQNSYQKHIEKPLAYKDTHKPASKPNKTHLLEQPTSALVL